MSLKSIFQTPNKINVEFKLIRAAKTVRKTS